MNALSRLLARFTFLRSMALVGLMLGAASSALAAKTYSDNGDGTVTDPTTGLTWMRCSMGQVWDGTTCTGTASPYTWTQANALTGTVTFAGQSDWRLPNIRELQTIADRSVFSPAIDTGAFPATRISTYWSGSPSAKDSSIALAVNFNRGYVAVGSWGAGYRVRLVRGGQSLGLLDIARPNTDYRDQGDGTLMHVPTRLTWQRCAVGQSWTGSTCSGTASTMSWDGAKLLTSQFAGKLDWRLPTEDELVSLVDYSKHLPAINTALFPNTPSSSFWSDSPDAGSSSYAWYVEFNDGFAYFDLRSGSNGVRLVRGGQSVDLLVLTVSKTGVGQVTSGVMPGIACGKLCSSGYNPGEVVTLNATPAANLISWGGACASAGTTATCTVTMDAAKSVTASFVEIPVISGLPTALTFVAQNIGSTSAAQSVIMSNTGTTALAIGSIVASGDYAVTHNCGTGLGLAGFCTLNVTFSPTASGTRTGSVTINSNAPGSPPSIALTGIGQGGTGVVNPSTLSFAAQGVGTTSAAQVITLTNTGVAALNISSIVASGNFARTTTCGATLARAANCTISVTYTPTALGASTGSIVITSDSANSPVTVGLSGIGVASPVISLNPNSLTFASQNLGTSSMTQTIALSNTGTVALNLTSIAASGDFAATNNCGAGIGGGGSCVLSVIFTPTVAGTRNGAITITSNAVGSPHSVSLSGVGTPSTNFPGNRSNYSITKTSTGFSIRDNVGAGGAVELAGTTQIKFADVTVNLLIGDLSKTIPADSLKTLIELYVALFNRIPDSDGLSYWISQYKSGSSINQIAESFYQAGIQYSSLTGFSAGMSNDDFINTAYNNVLGRSGGADAGGLAYWRGKLLDGSATHGSLVTDILYAAHTYKTDPTYHGVADLLDNKYSVATFFCLQQGLNYNTPAISIAEGMAIAAAVTPTSTAAAIAVIMVNDSGFDLTAP